MIYWWQILYSVIRVNLFTLNLQCCHKQMMYFLCSLTLTVNIHEIFIITHLQCCVLIVICNTNVKCRFCICFQKNDQSRFLLHSCCSIVCCMCSDLQIIVCLFVPFHFVIVLFVLPRFTSSDYPFDILKLFVFILIL